jgi:hypothetical protein
MSESKWQDISTAPKDGTHILGSSLAWGPPRIVHGFARVHGWYCPYTHDLVVPTMWQPLPSPPEPTP